MQITYQKLGNDHPMFGKVEYLVADGTQPLCYKTKEGYIPLEASGSGLAASVETKLLYILSFKVNNEAEEMTFTSKKTLEKIQRIFAEKAFITDMKIKTYKIVA